MIKEKIIKNPENFNKLLDDLYAKRDTILNKTSDDIFKVGDGSDGGEQWESRTEAIKEFTDFITDLTLKHAQAIGDAELTREVKVAHDHLHSSEKQVHDTMLATKSRLQATLPPLNTNTATA